MAYQVVAHRIAVRCIGEVLASSRDQVRQEMAEFLRRLPPCWDSPRLRLTTVRHRDLSWAAMAQANVEFTGEQIRAQVAAPYFARAGKLLVARLSEQLDRLGNPTQGRPWPPRSARAQSLELPAPQRRIIRAKRYSLTRCDVDRAALLMDIGDYDFYLFSDVDTGHDAILTRVGPTGYRLTRLDGLTPPQPRTVLPITINVHPVPRCAPGEMAARLDSTGLAFTFFRHSGSDRGAVVYRRYDGHYGLITTSAPNPWTAQPHRRAWTPPPESSW